MDIVILLVHVLIYGLILYVFSLVCHRLLPADIAKIIDLVLLLVFALLLANILLGWYPPLYYRR